MAKRMWDEKELIKIAEEHGGEASGASKEYVDKQDATTLTSAKAYTDESVKDYQPKLTAGENISISEDNVISTTGGGSTYNAGTGITIADNTISVNSDIKLVDYATSTEERGIICQYNTENDNWISFEQFKLETGLDYRIFCTFMDEGSGSEILPDGTYEILVSFTAKSGVATGT